MSENELRKLARKIRQWDSQTAFREFYYLCYDRFFRIAYHYTRNEEWSQEIVLDAFMKLWEKREILADIATLEDYCFVVVKNITLNYLSKEARRRSQPFYTLPEGCGIDASPEDSLINDELFAIYVKELDKLPPRCREVFLKVKEEKQSYAQVAEELGISVKTVDAQVQKAVIKLKDALRPYVYKNDYY